MDKTKRKDLTQRRYLIITAIIGFVFFAAAVSYGGIADSANARETLKIICDGLFVTATLMIACWLIGISWYTGTFDVFLFAASLLFIGKHKDERNQETPDIVSYREKKKLERRYPSSPLIIGLIFLVFAVITYIAYKVL